TDNETTRLVRQRICERHRNPCIGRQLAALAHQSGLLEVQVVGFAFPLTELSQANNLLRIGHNVEGAVTDGRLSADRAAAWVDDLARRDAAGIFLSAVTAFMVSGRVV